MQTAHYNVSLWKVALAAYAKAEEREPVVRLEDKGILAEACA
jgi:hypothetical protein